MCVTTYTREQLISVNNNTLRPSSAVLSSISDCVLTVSHHQQSQKRRKTRRRHRAGRGSCRTISSLIGNRPHDVHSHQTQSHQCHLVSFRPVNNLENQKSANLCHLLTVQKSVIQRDTPPSYLLKAGLVNVQSVRNKIDHIIEAIISHDLDILILTDTWLTTDDKDQFFIRALNIKGYKFYSFPRGNNTEHGGVGIIIRSSINIRSASQCDSTNFENCILSLDLKQQHVDLCAVYRPPPSDKNKFTVNKFIDEFGDLLQSYASNSTPVAFLGDFNFTWTTEVMQMQIGLPACCIHLTLNNMCHHPPIALDIPLMQSYLVQGMVWCQMCMLMICSPITASSSALYHTLRYRDPVKQSAFASGALLISQLSPAMLVTAWHWFQSPRTHHNY